MISEQKSPLSSPQKTAMDNALDTALQEMASLGELDMPEGPASDEIAGSNATPADDVAWAQSCDEQYGIVKCLKSSSLFCDRRPVDYAHSVSHETWGAMQWPVERRMCG